MFSFYFRGLGVGTCSLDAAFTTATVRNRPQQSATVREEDAMAVPMGNAAKVVTFGGLNRRVASFVWQAWHFVTLQHVS